MVCIILKVDLSCCSGCQEWICKRLKSMDGVGDVKLEEDKASLVVSGEGLDVAEIVRQVKKRKPRVDVVSTPRLPPSSNGSHYEPSVKKLPNAEAIGPVDPREKPKNWSPRPPPIKIPSVIDDHQQQNRSIKEETLVTERFHTGVQDTKIRTRVTTSHDACTCIRLEETRFIIDRHVSSLPWPPSFHEQEMV